MHRAEEGFNWNEHNKTLCWKKYEEKKQPITELPIEGFWEERGSANQAGRIESRVYQSQNQ
jgi:hypothetical protein